MESKTATAVGAGIVTVITPLVFPAVSLSLGIGLYAVAGGLFLYAGRHHVVRLLSVKNRIAGGGNASDGANANTPDSDDAPSEIHYDPPHEAAELPLSLVRRLAAEPISSKTVQALRVIASAKTPEFHMKDVIDAVDGAETYLDVRGIWAGLTRRTRTILNDPSAQLICWRRDGIYESDGDYVDHIGKVSALTHSSLRKYFGIP